MNLSVIPTGTGGNVICDPEALMIAYGAYAIRISPEGAVFLLIAGPDDADWINVLDAELVQAVGRASKARKQ